TDLRRLELVDEREHRSGATSTPGGTERRRRGAQGPDEEAIRGIQRHVAERRRQAARVAQLGRLTPIHAATGVDQQVDVQDLLLFIESNKQGVGATVDVPVDAGWIVALDVVAVVRELEARAFT